jgi:PAS domain S-box-containing protein
MIFVLMKKFLNLLDTANENLETYYDLLPDVVARFDREFRHLYVNRAIEPITGKKREDFFGKSNAELGMPTELVELWHGTFKKIFQNKNREEIDFAFPSANELRHFHMIGNPEFDENGNVESVLVVTRDLTEKKILQEKMIQAVRSSSYESIVTEFAHHVNNPLSIVMAKLEMVEALEEMKNTGGKLYQHFQTIKKEIDRINDLVLNMKRVTAASPALNLPKYSMKISEVIDAAVQMCAKMHLNGGVKIQIDYSEDTILKSGFSELLESILEILKNALESAQVSENPMVRIETKYQDSNFKVMILDSGKKIPDEVLEKVWLPFVSTKGPSRKGLGLTIAKSRILQLGGCIEYSRNHDMNQFKLMFPLTSSF